MRTVIKSSVLGFMVVILISGNVFAQQQPAPPPVPGNKKGMMMGRFSDQQKVMLKQESVKKKGFKEAFKASISQKQKDILADPRLIPADRQKQFRASFTDQQVSMIKSNKEEMKKMKAQFSQTLTPDQKIAMKRMKMGRNMNNQGSRGAMSQRPGPKSGKMMKPGFRGR
jgi:hypothetical protein